MSVLDAHQLAEGVDKQRQLAEQLFQTLLDRTRDTEGVTRAGWGEGEQAAVELLHDVAHSLGLETSFDELGQIYITLPGRDRSEPQILIGSHLDSIPRGGNFDGYAGVVAGVVSLATLKEAGAVPQGDITVMGIRGEESVWYGIAYIGSRFAVGDLPFSELEQLHRADTRRSIIEHISACGYDTAKLQQEIKGRISPENTKAYLELHIEQGPVLDEREIPVAIPSAIRGNVRYPEARCLGRYGHASAAPIDNRQDAMLAVAELIHRFDLFWQEQIASGAPDTQLTVGRVHTDSDRDGMTIVAGECRFTFNFGGTTSEFIAAGEAQLESLVTEIATRRNVKFEMERRVSSEPVVLNEGLRSLLFELAADHQVPCHEMATVGHDAAVFSKADIPTAMILVRNQNGSHNPEEAMRMVDFMQGTHILTSAALRLAGET
jgi:N-carbamoyl-L-amino-acid hydrolase